jgi:deazaflavin-dependent oxidoreductase (nitroreductase family)
MTRYARTPARRLLNTLETARIRLGAGPSHRHLLTVIGSRSGRRRTTPVAVVTHGSERWLVAPYGEVGWVRNVRAAGRIRLERHRRREDWAISEVDPAQAGPILREYVGLEPITRPFFAAAPEAPVATFAAEAARHPVFRLLTLRETDSEEAAVA